MPKIAPQKVLKQVHPWPRSLCRASMLLQRLVGGSPEIGVPQGCLQLLAQEPCAFPHIPVPSGRGERSLQFSTPAFCLLSRAQEQCPAKEEGSKEERKARPARAEGPRADWSVSFWNPFPPQDASHRGPRGRADMELPAWKRRRKGRW